MYSKRRSRRRPGSPVTPWVSQFVFTMQKAAPQDAHAVPAPAQPSASAAGSNLSKLIMLSIDVAPSGGVPGRQGAGFRRPPEANASGERAARAPRDAIRR